MGASCESVTIFSWTRSGARFDDCGDVPMGLDGFRDTSFVPRGKLAFVCG